MCISILHSLLNDRREQGRPPEHGTILLSIISLLNELNTVLPVNLDTSVRQRKREEGEGRPGSMQTASGGRSWGQGWMLGETA